MKFQLKQIPQMLAVALFPAIHFPLQAQTLHQIYQKPGTEQVLHHTLLQSGVPATGTATLVLVPPMACPRCEGLINPFISKLKAIAPQEPIAVFAFYPLPAAATAYLQRRDFKAAIQVASSKKDLLSAFSFSTPDIQVPFFVRVDMLKGRILNTAPALGITLNDAWVNAFLADTLPNEFRTVETEASEKQPVHLNWITNRGREKLPLNVLEFQEEYVVKSASGFILSLLQDLNFQQNRVLAVDDLSQSIVLFNLAEKTLLLNKHLQPGSSWEKKFIAGNVPDTTVNLLKKMNLINTMIFMPQFVDSSTVFFTGSFPEVYWTNREREELDYKNKLVFAFLDLKRMSLRTNPIRHADTIDANHTAAITSPEQGLVFLPIKKGWPLRGTSPEPPVENEKQNPFSETFYSSTPAFAVFDTSGKFVTYLGNLSAFYKDHRLGYAYAAFDLQTSGDSIFILDKTLGILDFYDRKGFKKRSSYQLWKTDIAQSVVQNLDYITGFKSKLTSGAVGFTIKEDTLYYVKRTAGGNYLKFYSLKTRQEIDSYYIPDRVNGSTLTNWYFRKNSRTIYLCALGVGEGVQALFTADIRRQ